MKPLIQENGATTKSTGKRLSSKGISVVDDPELEQAKTSDNSEALLSLSINDHSEKYAVLYYTIPICLLSAMMDNNQIDIVTRNAKQYGGGYFVLIYFVFNLLVGFAPIELFVAMSQYTRAGMTKIFGIYAKLFKCIGIGMLATVFCFQSAAIHRTADKLAFITRYGSHPEQLITCHFPEFDCSHVILSNMSSRICCTSVYHAVKCRNNSKFARNHAFSVGEQCLSQPPDRGVFRPAAVIAESIREKESYDPIFSVFSVFLITLIGATAFTGLSSFSVVISIFYIATTIAILIFTVGVIFGIGNISLGLRYFIRISELYKLFQLKMLVDLTFMCFSMVALKFFILSIACYLHRSFNPYTWSTIIYLKRAFVDVLFLMVNLSILGRFEEEGHRSSVSILTDVKQYARVIPEFFGTFDNFGFFFYLYYIVAALMNFGQLAGPFFVCYTLAKDHFPMKSQKVENIGIFFLTFCHFLISLIGDSRHEAMYGRNLIQSYWGSCFLVMAIFAIVFLYGPLELELDRVRIVKPTMSKKQEYLDKLSTYRIDLLRVVITPLLTLILVIGTIYVFAHAAQPPEGKNKMIHAIDIVMLCFPITYFFFYQIMLHRKRTKHNINLKKLLLPTKNHPSYSRIMLGEPNTNEYQKTLMPQRSFTRV